MKPVDFHPDADREAHEAAVRYESMRTGLGDDFRVELGVVLSRIQQNPQMYAAESGTIRIGPLDRFPYAVYYEELIDRIWVAAVGHHSRRPGYWARRRPN